MDFSKLSDEEIDARLAAIEAEEGAKSAGHYATPLDADLSKLSDEEIDARLLALDKEEANDPRWDNSFPPPQPEFSWPRGLAEAAAQRAYRSAPAGDFAAYTPQEITEHYQQERMPEFIQTQKPQTAAQRIGTDVFGGAVGAASIPGAGLPGALYGGVSSLVSSGLQELGANPWAAELAGLAAAPYAINKGAALGAPVLSAVKRAAQEVPDIARKVGKTAKAVGTELIGAPRVIAKEGRNVTPIIDNNIARAPESLSEEEKALSRYLQTTMGEEALPEVLHNIKNRRSYPVTKYEPMTAEVAEDPVISQLHRLRYEVPGSGLARTSGNQNIALQTAFEGHTLGKASSPQLKDMVGNELAKREKKRSVITKPLYAVIEPNETPINHLQVKKFLTENKKRRGVLATDVAMVEKVTRPSESLSVADKIAAKNYNAQKKDIYKLNLPPEVQKRELALLEKPHVIHPKANELHEAHGALNAVLDRYVTTGQKQRAKIMRQAMQALKNDLDVIPEHAIATSKYKELSGPVNEILKHPTMKGIPKSRANNIYAKLFNRDTSADNMNQLKKVLGSNSADWKAVQEGTVNHLKHSITNAGAEGKARAFSYPKLRRFLENHEDAIRATLGMPQLKFLSELKGALRGQNIAKTLGKGEGSPTQARLATDLGLRGTAGQKVLNAASYIPHVIPYAGKVIGKDFRFRLNRYMKTREADMMGVLDNVLKKPEELERLLSYKFDNQTQFNKYLDRLAQGRGAIIASTAPHSKEKNDHD